MKNIVEIIETIDTVTEWVCPKCGWECWCTIPKCMTCGVKMKPLIRQRRKYEKRHQPEVYIIKRNNKVKE